MTETLRLFRICSFKINYNDNIDLIRQRWSGIQPVGRKKFEGLNHPIHPPPALIWTVDHKKIKIKIRSSVYFMNMLVNAYLRVLYDLPMLKSGPVQHGKYHFILTQQKTSLQFYF